MNFLNAAAEKKNVEDFNKRIREAKYPDLDRQLIIEDVY